MKKITIAYSLESGEIYTFGYHEEPQGFELFGKFKDDMKKSFGIIHINYNEEIIKNIDNFKVDILVKTLIPKLDLNRLIYNLNRNDLGGEVNEE